MSRPLDDEWGIDGAESALLAKYKKMRIIYAACFVLVGAAWGWGLNYIEDHDLLDVDIAALFFTVSGILLGVYSILLFKKIVTSIVYTVVTFVVTLGVMILLVNTFNLNQNTLPILCFMSSIIAVVLAWAMPLKYKRP
ncbi:MAG: hypothetical protein GY810_06415 [Aureispira sp.]|nr:hypothetical protein [Aureispira sp.]